MKRLFFSSLLMFLVVSHLGAQNARMVVEPFFPPLCTTVDAQLTSSGGSLAPADEQKLDTARIQHAIDRCGKGRAVRLRVDEEKNAFLTGPLELRPDIALILDRGVTLFASRDAAVYARTPGSCGAVSDGTAGCKPLIAVDHASDAALMGDGVIDGRGGDKMLGSQLSWWDLGAQAGSQAQAPRLIAADRSDNFTLYRITLKNAPAEAAVFDRGDGFMVWGVRVDWPRNEAARSHGIVTGKGAKDVVIRESLLQAGDQAARLTGTGRPKSMSRPRP